MHVPETAERRRESGRSPDGISPEESVSANLACQAFHLACCCPQLSPLEPHIKNTSVIPLWPDILPMAFGITRGQTCRGPCLQRAQWLSP